MTLAPHHHGPNYDYAVPNDMLPLAWCVCMHALSVCWRTW